METRLFICARTMKIGQRAGASQRGQQPALAAAHGLPAWGGEVIQAREMQPAMHDIECQFQREGAAAFRGFARRAIHRHANFPGEFARVIAGKSDHIRRRRVVKKISMQARQRGVGQKREGDFPGGRARAGLIIQNLQAGSQRRAGKTQARVAAPGRPCAPRRRRGAKFTPRRRWRSHWPNRSCRWRAAGWGRASRRCSGRVPCFWRTHPSPPPRDRKAANAAC